MMKLIRSLVIISIFIATVFTSRIEIELPTVHLNQIQTVITHNSYKFTTPTNPVYKIPILKYSFPPIEDQLNAGVRGLEIDFQGDFGFNTSRGIDYPVRHYKVFDTNSHCASLFACMDIVKKWSDENANHPPLLIYTELKGLNFLNKDQHTHIENVFKSIFGIDKLITPDSIRRNYGSVHEALIKMREEGLNPWPKLEDTNGKIIFVHTGYNDSYVEDEFNNLKGRISFPFALETEIDDYIKYPNTAIVFVVKDDQIDVPGTFGVKVKEVVQKGYLVRVRSDQEYSDNPPTMDKAYYIVGSVLDELGNHNGLMEMEEVQAFADACPECKVTAQQLMYLAQVCRATFPVNTTDEATTTAVVKCFLLTMKAALNIVLMPPLPSISEMRLKRDVSFSNGAHFISTDYFFPSGEGFVVRLPQRTLSSGFSRDVNTYACNTVTRPQCSDGTPQTVVNIFGCKNGKSQVVSSF